MPRSEIMVAINLLIFKCSFKTKTANYIANTGFKKVIATASEAGINITLLNKIATRVQPQADLVMCNLKLGLLNPDLLKKIIKKTVIKAKKTLAKTICKGVYYQ